MSEEPSEPAADFIIPMTRLQLEPPTPPAVPPPVPPPPFVPPPVAIPLVKPHHGPLPLVIVGISSGIALGAVLVGGLLGYVLSAGFLGALPGFLLGLVGGLVAFGRAEIDLIKMHRGQMNTNGQAWAARGRWVGLIAAALWGGILYTWIIFQIGYAAGKSAQ